MPIPEGTNTADFHSMVNSLVAEKGLSVVDAHRSAIRFFTNHPQKKKSKPKAKK